VIFDPKLKFELPREIGPLLEQTVSVSVAEGFDACFELSLATQNTVASFEKQFAVAQADAKEMAEKLRSATTQNIDAAFGYALKLAQAATIHDADRFLRRRLASHVAPNDPLHLIFALCQNFRDYTDWQAGDVKLSCGCAAQGSSW
jgi:hypothetical protein